jgi:hypothetical protein
MFTSDETYVLLTDPMRHAPRALSAAAPNIHFPPESWGPGGIERIDREAGGWPHLVQLIAQALTDIVNRTGQGTVNDRTFDEALDMSPGLPAIGVRPPGPGGGRTGRCPPAFGRPCDP